MPSADVKIGIYFPDFVWPATGEMEPLDRLRACLARCQAFGFDVWVPERLLDLPRADRSSRLEPLVFLSYAAAVTSGISVGTQVLLAPFRHPVLAAKQIATLQALSQGRFQLGIGTGWHVNEFEAMEVNIRERGSRTDEFLEAVEVLLTEEDASFEGRYSRFNHVALYPRTGMPPVWVAGGSRRQDTTTVDPPDMNPNVLKRIVRAGNWMSRNATTLESMARDWKAIQEEAQRRGRDPHEITFGHVNWYHITDEADHHRALEMQLPAFFQQMGSSQDPKVLAECYLMGTTEDIAQRLQDVIEMGCTYLCLGPTSADPDQIDLLASEVLTKL